MVDIVSTTPGLYPLPDWAKEELKELKGNQKEDLISGEDGQAVESAYNETRAELVDKQKEASLDRIVEGQARWDDMLAHPLVVTDAVETRGIVRYYDNNNFYREPVVTGELAATGDVGSELTDTADRTEGALQAVLPGPYTLADLATDEHYGDETTFLEAITEFLAEEAAEFPQTETLFLLEPSLVTAPPDGDVIQQVPEAIDAVATTVDAEVVLYPYWGSLTEKVYAHVMDAEIDALGFDLVADSEDTLYNAQEYGTPDDVALGVVDGQNTRIESPETIRERIEWFDAQTPQNEYERVYATTNTETFYLPVSRFEEKLEALAAAPGVEVTA